jgi:hypothetical protein
LSHAVCLILDNAPLCYVIIQEVMRHSSAFIHNKGIANLLSVKGLIIVNVADHCRLIA